MVQNALDDMRREALDHLYYAWKAEAKGKYNAVILSLTERQTPEGKSAKRAHDRAERVSNRFVKHEWKHWERGAPGGLLGLVKDNTLTERCLRRLHQLYDEDGRFVPRLRALLRDL